MGIILKLKSKAKHEENIKRAFYEDRYNSNKIWEVAYLKNGYLLRLYIRDFDDGSYHQYGKGYRYSKKHLKEIALTNNFQEIDNVSFA